MGVSISSFFLVVELERSTTVKVQGNRAADLREAACPAENFSNSLTTESPET
jgi:hypothetical protein